MKKITLSVALLAFAIMATAQNMAKEQAESISTYLNLDASQKKSVFQIYKTSEDKEKQEREAYIASHKPSKETLEAREKAEKSNKNRKEPTSSVKHGNEKAAMSSSKRFLLIAHRTAKLNPSIEQELKKVFTPSQYEKWQKVGKN